jgi:6-phosphofructo-2-kinase / fructose-2,6-biphosphatase 4
LASSELPTSDSGGSTANHPNVKIVEKAQMGEINPGVWDGFTPDQARKFYPDEWDRFSKDPYAYRAPRAESYHDLCGGFKFYGKSPVGRPVLIT